MRKNNNKKISKLHRNRKTGEYVIQKNDEQLHREKILNSYEYIRSQAVNII